MRYWQSDRTRSRKKRRAAPRDGGRSIAAGGSLKNYPFLRSFYQHQAVINIGLQKFLFLLIIATLLYAFVFGDAGAFRVLGLRHEKATLEKSLAVLQRDTVVLEEEIASLKTDPFQMERLGRERYGYIYPGDRVYKIVHPQK